MFGHLLPRTKQFSSLIISLAIGYAIGNPADHGLNFHPVVGSGSGSGSGIISYNGSCDVIFEEYDNCDYYVATTDITCAELESMQVDCSGCQCEDNVDIDDSTTTTTTPGSETTTTTTTTTATTTTSTNISPITTLESEVQKIASLLEESFMSEDFLQRVSTIPELSSVTKIVWISTDIITDSNGGDSVEAEDEVRMSCAVTGYTIETFNEQQQNAFVAVIAEESNVDEEYVEILAVRPSDSRRLSLRSSSRRYLDSDEVVIDFSIQIPLQQEIDDEQPIDSGAEQTITIVVIVVTVVFVTVVATVLVVLFVVVPRYRNADSSIDTESASYPGCETTLGSPKGIQMGVVVKKLQSNGTPLTQRESEISQFDAAEQRKACSSPAQKMVAGAVNDVLNGGTERFEQTSSRASAGTNSTENFSQVSKDGNGTVVLKIPSTENLGPRSLSNPRLNLSYKVMPSAKTLTRDDDNNKSELLSI